MTKPVAIQENRDRSTDSMTDTTPVVSKKILIFRIVMSVLLIMAAIGLSAHLLKEELLWLGRMFVENLGGLGVALGFFIPDSFPNPVWHDAFLFFALVGGMQFWTIVFWAYGGSITGASIGYWLGRLLKNSEWFKRFMAKRGIKDREGLQKYGLGFMVVAAMSPLPFSLGAWSCGALAVPFWKFFTAAQIRLVRVALYLWLIDIGIVRFVK